MFIVRIQRHKLTFPSLLCRSHLVPSPGVTAVITDLLHIFTEIIYVNISIFIRWLAYVCKQFGE